MTRIEFATEVADDFDRFFEHQARFGIENTGERLADIIDAIGILANSPLIGRKVEGGKRELVIGHGSRGYVALYRWLPDIDTVVVLALRSQREAGCKRNG
jgi:toxin ParE1/3/4